MNDSLSLEDKLKKIDDIVTRGVGEFIDPDDTFRHKLIAKAKGEYRDEAGKEKDIIIKFGVDPTRADIHLGHMVCFRKLRQFQDLGCKVIFLIGDFTAQIGDPTGKSKIRPEMNIKEIRKNVESFLQPINRILLVDSEKFEWMPNSEWYTTCYDIAYPADMSIGERATLHQASLKQSISNTNEGGVASPVTMNVLLRRLRGVSLSQLKERDMFQKRIEEGEPLFMHEMLYPILQGLDSVMLAHIYGSCDLEIGGTDQTFNMLMGREMMNSEYNDLCNSGREDDAQSQIPLQSILSFKLLEGLDGKEKMSKSLDNYIGITDEPNMMLGKTMSLPDTSIMNYFELCTTVPLKEISHIASEMISGSLNPRDAKIRLAKELVTLYHSASAADDAEQYFLSTFSKKETPTEVSDIQVRLGEKYIDVLAENNLAESKSDARRKIEQGGVSLEGEKLFSDALVSESDDHKVLKVGKKDFVRLKIVS